MILVLNAIYHCIWAKFVNNLDLNVFSSAATCPECRNPTMMNNCRRIYFRYSNDSDSAQSHIDYLSKELAKKTMDLQNERSAKKKVEQDYGAQMKEMEYTIGKLKLKLKEVCRVFASIITTVRYLSFKFTNVWFSFDFTEETATTDGVSEYFIL